MEKTEKEITHLAHFISKNVFLSILAFGLLFCAEIYNTYRIYFLLAGVLCGVMAIILTYAVGGQRRFSNDWSYFQPLKGGARFVVFQAIGWTFFSCTILLPWVPWLLAWHFPQEAAKALVICAGASSVLGEVMMVCSLLTYNRPKKEESPPQSQFKEFLLSPRGYRLWTAFIALQAILSILACIFAVIADQFVFTDLARLILIFCAVMCFSLSLFLTYGVGGRWKYYSTEWRFYQPFSGGHSFVLLQALAWAFFSIAMLIFLLHMGDAICSMLGVAPYAFLNHENLPSFFVAAISGVIAQVLNALSLFRFKGKISVPSKTEDKSDAVPVPAQLTPLASLRQLCFVVMFYNLEKLTGIFIFGSMLLADVAPLTVVSSWVIFAAIYLPTYFNNPAQNGGRFITGLRGHWLFDELAQYFRLRVHTVAPLPKEHRYIFGFHPHGILPITCGWVHFCKVWQEVLPGIEPSTLTSSVIHYVPLMRDVCQFMSGLDVTRQGYKRALQLHGSAIVVPGGQREMIESRSVDRDVVICTAHKGFVRLALEIAATSKEEIYIVPVYSFGETQILDNLRLPVALQRWCINKLRANVFFFPYGMLGLPGVPRPERLTVCVGKPVRIPSISSHSSEHVDLLHRRFYSELRNAFEQYKVQAHHGDDNLLFVPSFETLSEEEFHKEWKKIPVVKEDSLHPRHQKHDNIEQVWVALAMIVFFLVVVYKAYGGLAL